MSRARAVPWLRLAVAFAAAAGFTAASGCKGSRDHAAEVVRATIPGEIVYASGRDGRVGIRRVRPSGAERPAPACPAGRDCYPAPDGRLALIVSDPEGPGHREALAELAGGALRALGPASALLRNPVGSPDGRFVVFEANLESFRDLYRLDLDGGRLTRLTDDRNGNFDPALSPDARHIAFVSDRDGNPEIYLMDASGGHARRLVANPAEERAPSWSPDGRSIAFVSDREQVDRLFLVGAGGQGERPLDPDLPDDASQAQAVWSPDGSRIAWVLQPAGGTHSIWVTGLADRTRVRVSPDGLAATDPSWSPDGRFLAFTARRGNDDDIYLARADGSTVIPLVTGPADDRLPRWTLSRPRPAR